jgi:hypothetical protein
LDVVSIEVFGDFLNFSYFVQGVISSLESIILTAEEMISLSLKSFYNIWIKFNCDFLFSNAESVKCLAERVVRNFEDVWGRSTTFVSCISFSVWGVQGAM